MQRRDGSATLRRWILVVVAAFLGVGVAAFVTPARTSVYRANTSLFFSVSGASTISDLSQGAAYTQNLIPAFVAVATTAAVLDPVKQQLGLHMTDSKLATRVHPKAVIGTVIMYISADGSSPQQAAAIANAVAEQLSKIVAQLSPAVARSGAKELSATVVAPARVPRSALATGGKKTRYVEGLLGGLLLGIFLARLLEGPRTLVRDEREISRVIDIPVLGRIEYARNKPLLAGDTEGPAGEAYRALRANVFALRASRPRSIVITASSHGEGATTTAINLALVAAETGLRVLLVEADLRYPSAAAYLKVRDAPGLIAAISNPGPLADAVRYLPGHAVDVLAAGGTTANPGELISSPEMAEMVATMVAKYDFVVLDAPAVLTSTDAAVLARHTDGVLVVVDTRKTKRRDLAAATASLHRAGAPLLGVVLNKTPSRRRNRKSSEAKRGQPKVRLAGTPPPVGAVGGGLAGEQRHPPAS
jgi:capsular exopolysaccharide synthesis family protein